MDRLPQELIFEFVQYLEIRDIIELIKTCSIFTRSLGQDEQIRKRKR